MDCSTCPSLSFTISWSLLKLMSILVYTFGYKPKEPKAESWEFPSGLVIRILGFHCRGLDSIPGQRSEIPEASQSDQKKKSRSSKRYLCTPTCSNITHNNQHNSQNREATQVHINDSWISTMWYTHNGYYST